MLLLGFCRTTVHRSPGKRRRRSHRERAASSHCSGTRKSQGQVSCHLSLAHWVDSSECPLGRTGTGQTHTIPGSTGLCVLLRKGNSSTLLTDSSCLDCRHEEEEMAYTEAKPCQLPGVLDDWHLPLPATKDGNGNI